MSLRTHAGGTGGSVRGGHKRFLCVPAGQSSSTELLRSCPVVTATGQSIGRVKSILIDARNRQLRYVVLAPQHGKSAVVIPWQVLYFDSSLVRLVYYTFS